MTHKPPAAQPRRPGVGQWACWAALAAYLLLLTAFLLTPNPFALAGNRQQALRQWSIAHLEWCGHFVLFAILGVLAAAACSRQALLSPRRWLMLAALFAYAAGVELAQCLVPPRSVELKDFLQNVAGLAAGALPLLAVRIAWRRQDPHVA